MGGEKGRRSDDFDDKGHDKYGQNQPIFSLLHTIQINLPYQFPQDRSCPHTELFVLMV
jgi:hypothetical protein